MHGACLTEFVKAGQHTCPLCKKSILNDEIQEQIIEHMDLEIALTPMPLEYRDKRVRVLCNDCAKESDTPFHILGLKCKAGCGSYNTSTIGEAAADATDTTDVTGPSENPPPE